MEEQDRICRDNLRRVEALCAIERKAIPVALGKDIEVASVAKQEENSVAMFEPGAEKRANQISNKLQKQYEEAQEHRKHEQMIEEEEIDFAR